MLVFVVRRLVVSFFILLASTALTYFLVAYSGNPLQDLLELRGPQREAKIAQRTQDLNLDQPVWIRYLLWLGDVARCLTPFGGACTLGNDRNGGAVLPQLQTAIGSTLRLVVVATILALLLGVVTGIVTALRQYSVFDYGVTFVAFLCFSLPVFWISTLLKQYVAIDLNTWLNNPVMTIGGISCSRSWSALLWALVIGGDRRRMLTVFGVGTLATGTGDVRAADHGFLRRALFRHPGDLRLRRRRGGGLDSPVRRAAPPRAAGADVVAGHRGGRHRARVRSCRPCSPMRTG